MMMMAIIIVSIVIIIFIEFGWISFYSIIAPVKKSLNLNDLTDVVFKIKK